MENLRMMRWKVFVPMLLAIWCGFLHGAGAINLRQGPLAAPVRPGATVTFTCDVDQKGGITVYWYRQESKQYLSHDRTIYTRVPADARRRYSIVGDRQQDVFSLQITDVVLADDGVYQCGYADGIGRFNVLASARLTVLIPPTEESPMCFVTTVSGDPKVRKVGDVVDLTCTTEGGNPIPDLTWYRGAEEVEESEGLRYAIHRQILRPQDANINYTCVMRGPLITQRRACSVRPMDVPPEVRIEPVVNSVTVGSTATFTCSMMATTKVGVRSYSWNVDSATVQRLQSSPGRMQLVHGDRVLEVRDVQEEDDNTVVTCQAQTSTGELLMGSAKLVIVIEPTGMTTGEADAVTTAAAWDGEEPMSTDGSSWHRAMRPTQDTTDLPGINDIDENDAGVTVSMKAKIPAFLTSRTFIMTSAAAGAVILIILVVVIVVVKIARRRSGKKMPITTPTAVLEHGGNNDAYATILEMKRKSGSTYKGSSTLPGLKCDRRIALPEVMRGGSSLSLTARNASTKGQITERSPLYAKPDKLRGSKLGLFGGDSKKDSLIEAPEEQGPVELTRDGEQEMNDGSTMPNKDLNAEGLIYADLVLNSNEMKPKSRLSSKKDTQYASIIPSGKP